MKNLYLFSILLVWTLCLPAAVAAQSDGANRIAAIRARLDTLTRRDEAYLGEVDLSVGEAPLSELLRSVAQVGGVNLSVRDGANLTVSCNFTRARIDELLLFLCEQYGLDVQVIGNIVSVFPYEAPVAPPPEPSVRFDRSDSTLSYDLIAVPLREVARRITDSTGVNLIVPQTLYERPVSGYIAAMPFAEALDSIPTTFTTICLICVLFCLRWPRTRWMLRMFCGMRRLPNSSTDTPISTAMINVNGVPKRNFRAPTGSITYTIKPTG